MEEFWTDSKEYNELCDAIGSNWVSDPDVKWVSAELHFEKSDGDHVITTVLWTNPNGEENPWLKPMIVDKIEQIRKTSLEWDLPDNDLPRWKPNHTDSVNTYTCSVCGHIINSSDPAQDGYNYCPNCGTCFGYGTQESKVSE